MYEERRGEIGPQGRVWCGRLLMKALKGHDTRRFLRKHCVFLKPPRLEERKKEFEYEWFHLFNSVFYYGLLTSY